MNKKISYLENIFIVISLFFFSQSFFQIILGSDADSPDKDSLLLRTVFQLIYLITFTILGLRWKKTYFAFKKNKWLLLLTALAVISVSWSSIPDISFRKTVALVGSTLFGIYFGSHHSFTKQMKILGCTFGLSIILNFFFAIFLPQYGVMNTEAIVGAWQGIYPHKNNLGASMFISFLAFHALANTFKQYRPIFYFAGILSIALIYLSESATALVGVLGTYIILETVKYLSLRSKIGVLLVLIFLTLVFLFQLIFIINFKTFLDVNDKDITLSGRTILWSSLWEFIKLRFWLGYGYGSFFSASHEPTALLWQVHDWGPVHAHNGYVQLWLNIGILGCFGFTLGYLYNTAKALFNYLTTKKYIFLWIFSFLFYTIFLNLTEVTFLSINSIVWIISVSSICSLNLEIPKRNAQKFSSTRLEKNYTKQFY